MLLVLCLVSSKSFCFPFCFGVRVMVLVSTLLVTIRLWSDRLSLEATQRMGLMPALLTLTVNVRLV